MASYDIPRVPGMSLAAVGAVQEPFMDRPSCLLTTAVSSMALPPQLRPSPTPQELEYITGEYVVSIEPLFRMECIRLVSVSRHLLPTYA